MEVGPGKHSVIPPPGQELSLAYGSAHGDEIVKTGTLVAALLMLAQGAGAQSLPPAMYLAGSNSLADFPLAGYCGAPQQHNPGHVMLQPQGNTASSSGNCDVATASAFASAYSQPGVVGTHVSVTAAGAAHCSYGPCGFIAFGAADATAYMTEFFNIKSLSLAYATPVTLLFSTLLHAPSTPNHVTASNMALNTVASMPGGAMYFSYDPNNPTDQMQSVLISTFIGAQLSMSVAMYAATEFQAQPTESDFSDIVGVAHPYLDAVTDDVELESASGYDYSTPTTAPEPTTLVLTLTGFFGVGALARARRRMRG